MSISNAHDQQPIIIVRRSGVEEDAHHGGVWKIAFADFMTALMAFFLVMWLTSVSDEATKRQIAQYFNPIELNSAVPPTQGLKTGESAVAPAAPSADAAGPTDSPNLPSGKPVGGKAEGGEDQAIFRDPYGVLAEIVAADAAKPSDQAVQGKPNGTGLPGLNGGDAYRDPFDPSTWQLQPNVDAPDPQQTPIEPDTFATVATPTSPTGQAASAAAAAPAAAASTSVAATTSAKASAEQDQASATSPAGTKETAETAKLEKELQETVNASNAGKDVKVDASQNGDGTITISLADTPLGGMFQIGSAKPTADAIRLMEKIAGVLKGKPGEIMIRGHTDARPYSGSSDYDNWRLSTSRAHMAYYMLMRGGLPDTRVESIEGVADRKPFDPADPNAASNRRIEIILKEPKP